MLRDPLIIQPIQVQPQRTRESSGNKKFISCNTSLCLLSCGKVMINIALLLRNQDYPAEINVWLLLVMMCDLVNIILLLADRMTKSRSQTNGNGTSNQENGQIPSPASTSCSASKLTKIGQISNNLYYFGLLGWTHLIYYQEHSQDMWIIINYAEIYMYWGYFFIVCAILSTIIEQNWQDFFSFFPGGLDATSNSHDQTIKNLPTKIYSSGIAGPSECFICLNNYVEGEKLAELPCNSKHHFHESCIQKWVKVNNTCPLCRKSITCVSNASTNNSATELQAL